jgi:hypothetical protein
LFKTARIQVSRQATGLDSRQHEDGDSISNQKEDRHLWEEGEEGAAHGHHALNAGLLGKLEVLRQIPLTDKASRKASRHSWGSEENSPELIEF